MKKYLILHSLHRLVFNTAATDGKVIEPTSALGWIQQVSGEVTVLVVIQQTQNSQSEGNQPHVPAVVMTLVIKIND